MIRKNYGEIQSDVEVKEFIEFMKNRVIYQISHEGLAEFEQQLNDMAPPPCDHRKLLEQVQSHAEFWRQLNSSRTSAPWINLAGQTTRKYYLEEDGEEEPHNDHLLFKNKEDHLVQNIGELKLDDWDALKTTVINNGDELYVSIKNWSKVENSSPWSEEDGLVLDPAELLVLAEHINQAIYFIFSRNENVPCLN